MYFSSILVMKNLEFHIKIFVKNLGVAELFKWEGIVNKSPLTYLLADQRIMDPLFSWFYNHLSWKLREYHRRHSDWSDSTQFEYCW